MAWPDIFFKARKPKPDPDAPVPPPGLQPPTVKPVPAEATTPSVATPVPKVKISTPTPTPAPNATADTGTRTLPAMHGVILRPPARLNTTTQIPSTTAQPPQEPIKNIEQLMAEADPVRALSETGSVRLLKRQAPETTQLPSAPPSTTPPAPITEPSAIRPDPALPGTSAATAAAATAPSLNFPPPPPAFTPQTAPARDTKPLPIPPPSAYSTTRSIRGPRLGDTPFILKPTVSLTSQQTRKLGPAPAMIPLAVVRRKTSMSDVARIILPPKRDEQEPPPAPPVPVPTVVPPSFSVAGTPQRPVVDDSPIMAHSVAGPLTMPVAPETPPREQVEPASVVAETPAPVENKSEIGALFPDPPKVDPQAHSLEPSPEPKLDPEAHQETPAIAPPPEPEKIVEPVAVKETPVPAPPIVTEKPGEIPALFVEPPKVDSEAHPPESAPAPEPKLDPEAHKETPVIAADPEKPAETQKPPESVISALEPSPIATSTATTSTEIAPAAPPKEKREFHLTNGEKVAGVVLSESPEAVYIEHGTLGVVTIPRNQIAKRLVEIILINGDRIVGDIMAETADMLYVRHASLGMLSVPRAQRSTRVVEAILTDGDRILGEVLTETETFTVIKSATLGTVTVPHNKVAMLNRKIEQIELKALPMSSSLPELPDKS